MSAPNDAELAAIARERQAGIISPERAVEREIAAFHPDLTPGRALIVPPIDVLNRPVTRRDLLAIAAWCAENARPDIPVRELLGEAWNYFSVQWREEAR